MFPCWGGGGEGGERVEKRGLKEKGGGGYKHFRYGILYLKLIE